MHAITVKVNEPAALSALPTPRLTNAGIEVMLQRTSSCRVKSLVERVKGVRNRDTLMLPKSGYSILDLRPTPLSEFAFSQPQRCYRRLGHVLHQALHLTLSCLHVIYWVTCPNPAEPLQKWRIRHSIECRMRISEEFRPACKGWDDAGLLPGLESLNSAAGYDSEGRIMPRSRERY